MSENNTMVELEMETRFRAEVTNTSGSVVNGGLGKWCESYEDAENDMYRLLVELGTGNIGTVDKVTATSMTWAKIDAVDCEKPGCTPNQIINTGFAHLNGLKVTY